MSEKSVLAEGISLYEKGNYTAALTFFLSLPEESEADIIDMAYYIGLCYAKLERFDDAMIYLEQVVTTDENNSKLTQKQEERILQCRYILAIIYCMGGRKKLADFELTKVLETGYKKTQVFSSLAYVAWVSGNDDESLDLYNNALIEDENNPNALNGMAYVLANRGEELTKALSMCKKALDLSPENGAYLDTMGLIYYKMGLYKDSLDFYKKSLKVLGKNEILEEHMKELERTIE